MVADRSLSQGYRVLSPAQGASAREALDHDVPAGFAERPKRLSSRWFYDDDGSELFARICRQPEYYLTRCELQILTTHKEDIAALAAGDGALVDVVDPWRRRRLEDARAARAPAHERSGGPLRAHRHLRGGDARLPRRAAARRRRGAAMQA